MTTTHATADLSAVKQRQQAAWSSGDYAEQLPFDERAFVAER